MVRHVCGKTRNITGRLVLLWLAGYGVTGAAQPGETTVCPRNNQLGQEALSDRNYGYVVLVRHGYAKEKRAWKQGDVEDCDNGHRVFARRLNDSDQVNRLGEILGGYNVVSLKSSPACRTMETAEALNLPLINASDSDLADREKSIGMVDRLAPAKGEVMVLVSHSEVIPKVLNSFRSKLSSRKPANTEAAILRKTDKTFQCIATILVPPGKHP